jgi:hypothetical protein
MAGFASLPFHFYRAPCADSRAPSIHHCINRRALHRKLKQNDRAFLLPFEREVGRDFGVDFW